MTTLLATTVRDSADAQRATRRLGEIADAAGLTGQDRTRMATALSDLLHVGLEDGRIVVDVDLEEIGGRRALRCRVSGLTRRLVGPGAAPLDGSQRSRRRERELRDAIASLRRIVVGVELDVEGRSVSFHRLLPAPPPDAVTRPSIRALSADAARHGAQSSTADLLRHNRELLDLVVRLSASDDGGDDERRRRGMRTVAHEVRSPLYAAQVLVESILEGESGPLGGMLREDVEMIGAAIAETLAVVDAELDRARLGADRVVVQRGDVDVDALLAGVRRMSAPLVRSADVELAFTREADVARLTSDATVLGQVLRNLVGNALKFTDAGSVRVHVVRGDGAVAISVADTGIGIAPEQLRRLFAEFAQVDGDQRGRVQGTGLGLSITGRLVAALDGTIEASSTPGQGSTFVVSLPGA